MSVSLRENITAVIETCFSETKDEIQEVAINRILELIRNDKADRKTEPMAEDIVRSFGFRTESYRQAKAKTEPQTEEPTMDEYYKDHDEFYEPQTERSE